MSRIVPSLKAGAGVVTTRGHVHWVVTEYGAVHLHGLTCGNGAKPRSPSPIGTSAAS